MDADEELPYYQITDGKKLSLILTKKLEEYNENNARMDLVLFDQAMEHICRISRIIDTPRGNALLVGVGGSGKQSLSRLAAFTAGCEVFEITLTRGYDETMFRDDLKSLYTMIGVNNQKVMFLFTDSHVADEGFLELINNMLTSGMVPALYADDEKEGVTAGLKEEVVKKGLGETKEAAWNYFVDRCRNNLHVVLGMSPVGDTLRTRCRNFPGMVNNTVIDWFQPWPEDALTSVANRFLAEENLGSDEVKTALASMCVFIHRSIDTVSNRFFDELRRKVYTTPKSYLDLINLYLSMLEEQRAKLKAAGSRLVVGVEKLNDTNAKVDGLQEELTRLQPVLVQKTKETEELIKQLRQHFTML